MANGFHRVEVTGPNGVTLTMQGSVPNDDFTSSFSDCHFTQSGCDMFDDDDW